MGFATWVSLALASLAGWMARNYIMRYHRLLQMEARYAGRYSATVEEEKRTGKPRMINAGLKGVRDAQRIARVSFWYDMPFMSFTSLEFALFKTYAIPTISSLLLATGQLAKPENAGRRFVDTGMLIAAMALYPLPPLDLAGEDVQEPGDDLISKDWTDPRSSIAIARTNYLHGRWKGKISNADLLYTLSLFMLEPAIFLQRYEWRSMTPLEAEAQFTVFYHIGRCMNIKDIPPTREELQSWVQDFEEENMIYAESNTKVAEYTVDLLLYHAPRSLHPFGYKVVTALLEPRLREAFGFEEAPRWLQASLPILLRARSWLALLLLPPSRKPRSFCPADAAEKIIEGGSGFCPATGITARQAILQGKTCPVGQHTSAAGDDLAALPRMAPGWVENEPWYASPAKPGSLLARYESLLVRPENRRGAPKWQNHHVASIAKKTNSTVCGFRLEECGPSGLELSGREQVLASAVRMNRERTLTGPWAFQAQVQPIH